MSAGNFRGGRKPFPKPSAFESEIHPTHKTSFCTPGISPLQGANLRLRKLTVRKSRTVFIHAAQKTGRMDAVAADGYIFGANTKQHSRDFAEVPLVDARKCQP